MKFIQKTFEVYADNNPDKVAIVASDKSLTFRELNEEANRIAHSLISEGVKCGDIVAIILPRTSHLIPAMFGVLKTGSAYMPLDPSYPQERIDYLISESGANYIINEENIEKYLSSNQIDNPEIDVPLDALFCALHTSGSTGKPKVTALTHKNVMNFIYNNLMFWDNVETVICVTIATFDVFMQDTLLSLALGKKVVLASNDQIYNQSDFEKMFENEENIMFFSTPTKLTFYIKQSKTAAFLKHISSLIVAGEVFSEELYDLLKTNLKHSFENNNPIKVINAYGPAETYIASYQVIRF